MMLSNAFQSRKMESMRSRNLGKLSMELSFPAWSLSDCATILQESVLARSGGVGSWNCDSPPLFFPFLFVRQLQHQPTLPAQGLPAGAAREGCTRSCRTRTR